MATYVDIRQPKGGSSRSLKRHLALGFAFFTLLLSAGLSFLIEHFAAESSVRQIGLQLAERAAETRDRLDTALYERLRDARALADLAAEQPVPVLTRTQLESLHKGRRPLMAWSAFADLSGRVVAAYGGVLEGTDVSQQRWFKRGLEGPVADDRVEGELMPPGVGLMPEVHPPFVALGLPVRNAAGRVSGVLVFYLDWSGLRETRPVMGGNVRFFVLSRDRTVLYGIEAMEGRKLELRSVAEATPARTVWAEERWPDGDRYITAVSVLRGHEDYPQTEWIVVVRQDPGEALAEVSRLQLRIAAAGVLIGLLFAGLAWWFADRVAKPLTSISEAADRLGAGERDLSIPSVYGYREIEHLSASLRAMLSNLRRQEEDLVQARDKLELRVRERTAEVTRTRSDLEATVIEREKAQAELAREKAQLELALEAAGVAVWTYDLAAGRVELSGQWAVILGGARGTTLTTMEDLIAVVPEDERAAVKQAVSDAARGIRTEYAIHHHVQRANGERVLTESRGKVTERAADGRAVRMAGTIRTITAAGQESKPPMNMDEHR